MTILWHKGPLLRAINGTYRGPLAKHFSHVSIDSRTIGRGGVFFAIRGDKFDGHDFVQEACAKGAGAAVVEKGRHGDFSLELPLIFVDDPLKALEALGQAARARCAGKILALTGSVGKTTTKDMLRLAFSAFGKTYANPGSFNNHWGVPLTLANMPADVAFGIFELGMNHAGEIRRLVEFVQPHLALITQIAPVHLEHFSSIDAIARAKAEIFEGLGVAKEDKEIAENSFAVLNIDDVFYPFLKEQAKSCQGCKIISFGYKDGADYRLCDVERHVHGWRYAIEYNDSKVSGQCGAIGRHNLSNIAACLACVGGLGYSVQKAVEVLSAFEVPKGRGKYFQYTLPGPKSIVLLDQSYNANPASMVAALNMLRDHVLQRGARRLAVLGDMKELGASSKALHQALAEPIKSNKIDKVFLVGPEMKALKLCLEGHIPVVWSETIKGLLPLFMDALHDGDLVLVKSSNSVGTSALVQYLHDEHTPI